MYNREKIIATLHEIHEESKQIQPYVVIAQPRRSKDDVPIQTFKEHGNTHINLTGYSTGFIDITGEIVDVARNYLIEQVLDSGAKYMLFAGDDTALPWHAFYKMHETAEANPDSIINGVYYMKGGAPLVMTKTSENQITPTNVDPGQIIDTWMCGMDCMLIPVSILRKLKEDDPELPFCVVAQGIEDIPFVGEDNFFTHRVRKAGFRILTDTDVQCLHVDNATGKYTAHPSVDLNNYYTNFEITTPITLEDKKYLDNKWITRLPKQNREKAA